MNVITLDQQTQSANLVGSLQPLTGMERQSALIAGLKLEYSLVARDAQLTSSGNRLAGSVGLALASIHQSLPADHRRATILLFDLFYSANSSPGTIHGLKAGHSNSLSPASSFVPERHNVDTEHDEAQAWFWSEKWQEMEREADEDIARGRVVRFDDIESFFADLET